MHIFIKNVNTKCELISKIDYSPLKVIDKFIDLLKSNNVEVKVLGRDEYVIKIWFLHKES